MEQSVKVKYIGCGVNALNLNSYMAFTLYLYAIDYSLKGTFLP